MQPNLTAYSYNQVGTAVDTVVPWERKYIPAGKACSLAVRKILVVTAELAADGSRYALRHIRPIRLLQRRWLHPLGARPSGCR